MWTASLVDVLHKFERYCEGKAEAHNIAAESFMAWNQYISLPGIILEALGIGLVMEEFTGDGNVIVQIIASIALIGSTMMFSAKEFLRYETKATEHSNASTDYRRISRKIEAELARAPDDRDPADLFMSYIQQDITRTDTGSPMISEQILDTYTRRLDKQYKSDRLFKDIARQMKSFDTPIKPDRLTDSEPSTEPDLEAPQDTDRDTRIMERISSRKKQREDLYLEFQMSRINPE